MRLKIKKYKLYRYLVFPVLHRGGTKLTVSGTSIDAVARPLITFGVMNCFVIHKQAKFNEVSQITLLQYGMLSD